MTFFTPEPDAPPAAPDHTAFVVRANEIGAQLAALFAPYLRAIVAEQIDAAIRAYDQEHLRKRVEALLNDPRRS